MAKSVDVRVDLRQFTKALQQYEQESSRDIATIVKGAAIDVAFKANQATPRAAKGEIPPASSPLYYALASANPVSNGGAFGRAAEAAQRRIKGRFVKGSGELKKAARLIRSKRSSAVSYSKALFLKLAAQIGGKVRVAKSSDIGNAKATETKSKLRPAVTFKIEGIEQEHAKQIIQPALQKGINAVAVKFRDRLASKLAVNAKRHSGKK